MSTGTGGDSVQSRRIVFLSEDAGREGTSAGTGAGSGRPDGLGASVDTVSADSTRGKLQASPQLQSHGDESLANGREGMTVCRHGKFVYMGIGGGSIGVVKLSRDSAAGT